MSRRISYDKFKDRPLDVESTIFLAKRDQAPHKPNAEQRKAKNRAANKAARKARRS